MPNWRQARKRKDGCRNVPLKPKFAPNLSYETINSDFSITTSWKTCAGVLHGRDSTLIDLGK
jgi:hypothetical protein